ncbi:MAG TPA: hypothetical protein VGC15_02350, partial [Acetobacteraceae bacterium]
MADGWDVFDAPGGSSGGGPGRAAPAAAAPRDDGWGAFDAPVVNGVPAGAPAPVQAGPALQPGQRTGMLANVGAALQEGAAGAINIASDPVGNIIGKPLVALGTGAYNLGARALGYQPLSPAQMNAALDDGPGPGDRLVAGLDRAVGAPTPGDVVPGTDAQRYARAGVQGAMGMAALGPLGGVRQAAGTLATGALSG